MNAIMLDWVLMKVYRAQPIELASHVLSMMFGEWMDRF